MNTFQTVANEFAGAFVEGKRGATDTFFYSLKDGAPSWIVDGNVMRELHEAIDDRLPCDWIYASVRSIVDSLVECDDADSAYDRAHEIAESVVDVYNGQLTAWLADNHRNVALVDDAATEYFDSDPSALKLLGTYERIKLGQRYALRTLVDAVTRAIETETTNREGI